MNIDRWNWLLDNALGTAGFLYAFETVFDVHVSQRSEQGITKMEDFVIRTAWAAMPDWTSYHNAVEKLAGSPECDWYGYNTTRLIMAGEIDEEVNDSAQDTSR